MPLQFMPVQFMPVQFTPLQFTPLWHIKTYMPKDVKYNIMTCFRMGVPKFYRWISERYPCLSQVLKEYQIPQFDNMYLDMNGQWNIYFSSRTSLMRFTLHCLFLVLNWISMSGIIHPCSHPNDEDAHFRITEDEIFQNIFKYIEVNIALQTS